MNYAFYAVFNSHGEPLIIAPTREQCERYIATQSAAADCCEIKSYPFGACWNGSRLVNAARAA